MNFYLCSREEIMDLVEIDLLNEIADEFNIKSITWMPFDLIQRGVIIYIVYGLNGDGILYINRKINRAEIAEFLSERAGFTIYPREIYNYSLFCEIGRIWGETLSRLTKIFESMGILVEKIDPEEFSTIYANQKFWQWRHEKANQIIN